MHVDTKISTQKTRNLCINYKLGNCAQEHIKLVHINSGKIKRTRLKIINVHNVIHCRKLQMQ